jgi:4-carboxymuconolactone decarboxylase
MWATAWPHMSRLPDPDSVPMTPEARASFDRRGGQSGGPSAVWRWVPEIAKPAGALVLQLRNGTLHRGAYRVMCLVVARTWSSDHLFSVHAKGAIEDGVAPDVIEAIRTRRVPAFVRVEERTAYELTTELLATHELQATTYERAVGVFGLEHTIELVTGIGVYGTIGALLSAFDVSVPEADRVLGRV